MEIQTTALKQSARQRSGLWNRFVYSQKIAPYAFVLPFVISFLLFFAYPVFNTIMMSFQDVVPGETKFIGLDNYRKLFNPTFFKAIQNSAVYTFWTLLVLIPLPLVLAVWLNSKIMRWKNFFRSTLFIPALTSVVVAGTIFRLIFGELPGSLLNQIVGLVGFSPHRWLFEASTGMLALVMLAVWRWTGINILYFLSGLQNIPNELYESAEIDGASTFQRFWNITLPLLKPVTIYVLTISIYGGFAMFTESYMLWSGNKSPNNIGLTMVGYIYQQGLEQNKLGMGSAIGITLLGLTMILNLIQLKFFGLFRKED
ncbi:carbohydrate ABC transporter permease [Paenibacillus gyeongsangnamensis]|uniref:carbohydrate ABC transporter permease n=1 Tax=Paenibacillus gyeongsangnamensis TaxID=3388067 RepID=UPI0039083E08